MALVIEDGTGIKGAEVVNSVTDADTYCTKRGIASWSALTNEQKEAALINGEEYLCEVYGPKVINAKLKAGQSLPFPTLKDGLPQAWKTAEMIAALESLQPGGLWAVVNPNAPFQVERTIGPITDKWAAPSGGKVEQQQKRIDRIDAVLAGLIEEVGFSLTVARA